MLKVRCELWNQNGEILRQEAVKAQHPRTRERLMALYEISEGKSATSVVKKSSTNPQTIMSWVHKYNQEDLTSLKYQRSGGRTPFLATQSEKK